MILTGMTNPRETNVGNEDAIVKSEAGRVRLAASGVEVERGIVV
jgi:hypothetical protein